MSERININDIQAFFRHAYVENLLKTNKEKKAYQKYRDIYHELIDAEYKNREYESLYRRIHFRHHSQKTIDIVKERVSLTEEIQKLELELENMEQSTLFKKIHRRALNQNNRKFNFNLKEKINNTFGSIGVFFYILIKVFISVLPFVMIDEGFILTLLFMGASMFFPLSSVVFWIWGLVCAINGVQDVFAIIYYIAFVVIWVPFFFSLISSFFDNKYR